MRVAIFLVLLLGAMPPGPQVPAAPPAPALIPPIDAAPPHPVTPPPLPSLRDDAPGETTPLPHGMRLTFGADRSDFTSTSAATLRQLAAAGLRDPKIVFNLYAHAPGSPEDTSTPRRLSLERGLGVRSVLIHAGIPSTRIYVRALGADDPRDTAPADRVDILLASMDTTAPVAGKPPA